MKTYHHLYPKIIEFENLHLAYKRAARGKRSKRDVAGFEFNLEESLLSLQEDLAAQKYIPGAYFNFRIYDPKPRLISAAPFRDRVVHHALCNIIEPIFERRFIHDTYACRVGKGTHAAIRRCKEFSQQYPYVLKCDLEHFFPGIDHQILIQQLEKVIACQKTRNLCRLIVAGGADVHRREQSPAYFPGDNLFAALRPYGLPIGNLTSQFWANVYLNPLDQFIKQALKCPAYLRYVDDFLLFSESKSVLHQWRQEIIRFAASLRMKLHEPEAAVFPVKTGIPFLGWRVYPGYLRLRRRNGVHFQRRFAGLRREYARGEIDFPGLDASVQGWVAHVVHGDTWRLREALLSRFPIQRTYDDTIPHLQQNL